MVVLDDHMKEVRRLRLGAGCEMEELVVVVDHNLEEDSYTEVLGIEADILDVEVVVVEMFVRHILEVMVLQEPLDQAVDHADHTLSLVCFVHHLQRCALLLGLEQKHLVMRQDESDMSD